MISFCFQGLVTATFAASLITSPAIGAHLARLYSENFVIALGILLKFIFSFYYFWLFRYCCCYF
jgi:hypothetical protein